MPEPKYKKENDRMEAIKLKMFYALSKTKPMKPIIYKISEFLPQL